MRIAQCDGCGKTTETGRYDATANDHWFTIEQGHEDPLDICSPDCLANVAAQLAIDKETSK